MIESYVDYKDIIDAVQYTGHNVDEIEHFLLGHAKVTIDKGRLYYQEIPHHDKLDKKEIYVGDYVCVNGRGEVNVYRDFFKEYCIKVEY